VTFSESGWERRVVAQVLSPAEMERRTRFLLVSRNIVDAAIDLAAESEGAFTVQEVAARAGVSLHTFYRSFPSKDDLSMAIFEEAMRLGTAHIAAFAAAIAGPLAQLRRVITGPITEGFRHPRGLSAAFIVGEDLRLRRTHPREVEEALMPYRVMLAEKISAVQAAGDFRGIDAMEDAEMIHHLMITRYQLLTVGSLSSSDRTRAESLWDFCLGALRRKDNVTTGETNRP
jgi:AcrR family transcriptional regulator